jgi:hypothetical protein
MDTVIERLCFEQACKHLASGALARPASARVNGDSLEIALQRLA